MAFYSDGSTSYFSLSLRPTGDAKVYVFRLTRTQISAASAFLPLCLAISVGTFLLVIAYGGLEQAGHLRSWLNDAQQTTLISALALIACLVAMAEVGFFFLVRFTRSSLVDDGGRRSLRPVKLSRKLSLMAYSAFLFAMLVPMIGLFILPGGFVNTEADFSRMGTAGLFFLAQLAIVVVLLMQFLILRLFQLLAVKPF
jgi:hypothetical protein